MANETQHHKVLVTPNQRLQLYNLAYAQGREVTTGDDGKKMRRFSRAFALVAIKDSADEHNGIRTALAISKVPSVFSLTVENLEYALKLQEQKRTTAQDAILGDLWDLAEAAMKEGYVEPEGPDFDPLKEDWVPVEKPASLIQALELLEDSLDGTQAEEFRERVQAFVTKAREEEKAFKEAQKQG